MKLPNGENAVIDLEKLADYCLNPDHPRGKHKARVFASACGLTAEHVDSLRSQLHEAALQGNADETGSDVHGRRYVIEYLIQGPIGAAMVRTAWIIRSGEGFPRFISAYVK